MIEPYTLEELKTLPQLDEERLDKTVQSLREAPNQEALANEIVRRVPRPLVDHLAEHALTHVANYAHINEPKIGRAWAKLPQAFQTQLTLLAQDSYGKDYGHELPYIFEDEFHECPVDVVQPFLEDNTNLQRRWAFVVKEIHLCPPNSTKPELPEQLLIGHTVTSTLEEPAVLWKILLHAVPFDRAVHTYELFRPFLYAALTNLEEALAEAKHPRAIKNISEIYEETTRQATLLAAARLNEKHKPTS